MLELKKLITELSSLMSVTGYEDYSDEKIKEIVEPLFDEVYKDNMRNYILVKRCGRENAPKILVDAHLDEIGMYVSEITEKGFLRVVNVGGLDTRIMQASDVVVYGKKKIYGVVVSTPPHLADKKDEDKLKPIDELLIDIGYTKKEAEEFISVGTPVGFRPKYTELLNGRLAGKGFDDKACAACIIWAVVTADKEALAGDVYVLLSAHEETDRLGGVVTGANFIKPDYAMVVDVNLAKTPDTKAVETVEMDGGAAITLSAVTDRTLTKMLCELCKKNGIKYQRIVSASSTGTNATSLGLVRGGVPVVDIGLPLKSMHTYNEVLSISDAEAVASAVLVFVCSKEIAEVFKNV